MNMQVLLVAPLNITCNQVQGLGNDRRSQTRLTQADRMWKSVAELVGVVVAKWVAFVDCQAYDRSVAASSRCNTKASQWGLMARLQPACHVLG
jgi:hypothetical protein